jgi:hypothetical protein
MSQNEPEALASEVCSATSRLIEIVQQRGTAADNSTVLRIGAEPSVLLQYTPAGRSTNRTPKPETLDVLLSYSADSCLEMKLVITAYIRENTQRGPIVNLKFILGSKNTALKVMPMPYRAQDAQRYYLDKINSILNLLNA